MTIHRGRQTWNFAVTCSVTDAASFAGMPAEPGAPSSGWTRTSCASSSAGGSPRGRESSWNSVYVTPLLTNPSGPRGANNEPLSPIEGSPGVVPTAKEESALLSASVATGTLVVSAVGVGILSFPHALATSRVPAFALMVPSAHGHHPRSHCTQCHTIHQSRGTGPRFFAPA